MREVLLAVDGSRDSAEAARFLARLARDNSIKVTVLTVIEPSYLHPDDRAAGWGAEQTKAERSAAIETYRSVQQLFGGSDASVVHELRKGSIAETIVQVASENDAELVVVGARGRSYLSRVLLGGTSDYVATHADCSVLVVRPRVQQDQQRPLRVVIGYQDTEPAQYALQQFSEFTWDPQTEVEIVSVSAYIEGFSRRIAADSETIKARRSAVDRAIEHIQHSAPGARARFIENEHIGEGLVRHLEQQETDLVVVGETPRGLIERIMLGSVSRFVLRHAPCSVWISRHRSIISPELESDHGER